MDGLSPSQGHLLADPREVALIEKGAHRDPFAFLGPHLIAPSGPVALRVFRPGAADVEAILDTGVAIKLTRVGNEGLFCGVISETQPHPRYRLRVSPGDDAVYEEDAYRFGLVLSAEQAQLHKTGNFWRAYDVMGAHPGRIDGVDGVTFAVWAPNAHRVSVVGDFNKWDGRINVMRFRHGCGVWEIFIPGLSAGAVYKFEIVGPDGALLPLKADPYARWGETPPKTASRVSSFNRFDWGDDAWMTGRAARHGRDAAISIYEVHAGSWRRSNGQPLSYRDLAHRLIPYVRDLGFTHIQLMPICEHPFDGSWGYQPIGLFSPSARFGEPDDLRAFIDAAHRQNIGVLVDWVPAHFPKDVHGLARFDGTALYEHADRRRGEHPDWGTLIYNFGRYEVANFLISNALYWLDQFHVDGLRVDAVSSMLYLDYSHASGEWEPNVFGGNVNLEAVEFLKRLNELAYGEYGGAMMVAEESTAWPGVSKPTYLGGLGFGYKWNMGWMNDTLRYFSRDPVHRSWHHDEITFGLLYAFNENFILPLSHDEVVHGKGSLLARMPGDEWRKFAGLRALYGLMWAHPGKKLMFMGGEFAQAQEWSHSGELDWNAAAQPLNAGVTNLVRDLNALYRASPALYEQDCVSSGFEWVQDDARAMSVFAFFRKSAVGDRRMYCVINMTPEPRRDYRIGVDGPGKYRIVLNTDEAHYGGAGDFSVAAVEATDFAWNGRSHSVVLTLPPLAAIYLEAE